MKGTVVNLYKFAGKGGTIAFFDINLDDTLLLKGCTLKQSKAGEYYWKPPAKPRTKNGEQVTDKEGRAVWDDHYRLMPAGTDDKKLTKAAYQFNQDITEQAVAQYDSTDAVRGKMKAKAATAATKTEDADEEGDLPF